ncbi:MAG: hypothetical protein K6E50_06170 [Lachnospiraceae bacterium]|nr:hypothetical protein [Lachnospiraceae bacterium]
MTKSNESGFTDVHCHLLPAVDDGAADGGSAREQIGIAAADGISRIFFTPHVRSPWLRRPWSEVEEAFSQMREWCAEAYPGLKLYLGSEFAFSESILREEPEKIRDMNGSGILLVEFKPRDSFERIVNACQQVQMAGYDVLLAHAERYDCMLEKPERARRIAELGVSIQINCDDIVRPAGFGMKRFLKLLLKEHLADMAGTDAHDAKHRRPEMKKAYGIVKKYTDEEYAEQLFKTNADILCKGKED